ncbi:helix-turn-helix domain-containing protein [Streptomyces sp. NPDC004629]|uniref:helix-turn-helix domain-containing protein n=1 Tax=Streptomyces sp. NPDC004629 TaxID=3364705 RepID=UPI0036AA8643
MPRWKALPDELDPQIKEFASQLRRLVDRSGLSVAALADRTGYSKTSWERYLNGRLLAPKGAIVALAEVTGTNPLHLTTMWELAERAWSRSEMRHDMTMEAIRISQARAALGEFGGPQPGGSGSGQARKGGSATATPGVAGPTGVSPTIPPQPTAPDADAREGAGRTPGTGVNSWGMAGYQGPSRAGGRTPSPSAPPASAASSPGASRHSASPAAASPNGAGWTPGAPGPYGRPPQGPGSGAPASRRAGGKRRAAMFLAGFVGVLVVIAAVFFLTDGGGDKENEGTDKSPSPSASTAADLPPGVKCVGSGCTGKDAETMGCSGDLVTTAETAAVGPTTVEVRYSKTCGAAWGRITGAGQGDEVRIAAGTTSRTGTVTETGDTIAYTPMVAVKTAAEAKACATLSTGQTGCTP